jgi:gliding motility-associated-like protein/fimbrial isopeptide formation D2 family protein/uncharacterized repeat protein (TIGR01451 family)
MKTSKALLLLGILWLFASGTVHSQVPQISNCQMPADYFVNEEFCFTLDLEESANTGFGPYLRIMLPPGVNLNSAQFSGIANLTLVDTSTGAWMKDPNLNTGLQSDSVMLPVDWTFYILDYPVGSVTSSGVALTTDICLFMDPNIVTIGIPLNVQFQAGYIFGNTPTGANGPTLGPLWNGFVTPLLYVFSKTSAPLPRHDRTPGPDWPLLYSLTANIANAQTVTGLIFEDDLPDSLMYIPGSIQAPSGCTVNSSGLIPGVPGGNFSVNCPLGIGTLGLADVQIQYAGYAVNVLDEQIGGGPCDEYKIVNIARLRTDQGSQVVSTDTVRIYNMTLQQESAPGMVVPGMTVTTTVNIQVSNYISAMDSFFIVVRVDDGLDFIGNSTLDGIAVAPVSILTNFPTLGATQVTYDLAALRGGLILPGDSLRLTYETVVRQNYQFTGAQVLARDELNTFVEAHYHLVDELPGVLGCNYNYKATIAVIPNQIFKDVIGGTSYVPGDMITYRLRMILPSGDANNVIFTDYFPIPIHNVSNISLVWGGANIVPGPNHLTSAVPIGISIIPGNNALVINFGNVMSTSSPETLEVYITVPVTTIPFANGLTHSNFLKVASDNTQLSTAANLQLTQVFIGAPMLSLVKGVSSVFNPSAWLSAPNVFPVNSDAFNVDANDTVNFVSTITNIGGAQAFHIQAVDPMPMQFTGCQIQSVTNAIGAPVSYSGTLFGPNDTLVIDSMDASGPFATTLINYVCEVSTIAVPWETITNTMSIAWASAINQDSLFARIKDSASVRVKTPTLDKTIRSISPGHTQSLSKAHVGEAVGYAITFTIPEGATDSLLVRDVLGLGMAFAGIDSIVSSSPDLICSLGPISNIVPTVDSLTTGAVQRDRFLIFYFEEIFNKNTDNSVTEQITIYYKARVLNATSNVRGTTLPNSVHLSWTMPTTGQIQNIYAVSPLVTVVEPTLELDKSFLVSNVTPGDSAYVTFTLRHDLLSDATAYDVLVTDTLPFGMNFVANSFSGACPSNFSIQPGYAGGIVSASWDSLEVGTTCQIRFKLSVDNSFPSCNDIINRGNLFWESVYDPRQASLPNCPTNILGVERTGFGNSAGQVNNYLSTSYDTLHVGIAYGGIPQITSNAPVCIGNSLELSCSPHIGTNVQYIWTTPTGIDTTSLPQLIRFPSAYADSGYYAVVVSDGGCLSPSSILHFAAVVPSPVVMATGDAVLCAGQDRQLSAVAFPAGNYSYLWTGPNGFISNQQNPILTNLTPQMAGNYSVQISGSGCTSAWSIPVSIQVLPRPIVATVNDTLACSYGIVDLVLDAIPVSGNGPFTFYWTGPGGFASTMEDAIIPNAMAINQGNYIVTMTDSMGCVSLPVTAVVDIHDAPQTPVITQQGVLCAGDPLTLVTTAYAGGSVGYYWVTPNGPVTTSIPSLNFPSVTTQTAGLYAVVVEIDGCQTLMSALSTVVVNAAPVAPNPTAVYGDTLNCAGDTLWLTALGDTSHTFLWTGPNGFTGNGAAVFVPNADPNSNGSYQVTVSNGNCIAVASVTINSILPYPVTPSLQQPQIVCEGTNVILQANPYNGQVVNYTWMTPSGLANTTTPSLLLQPVSMSDSGNYSLMVNVNGCNSLSSGTVQLEVNPSPALPNININQDTLCEGDTLVVSTTILPGGFYQWSGPAGFNSTQQNPPSINGVAAIHNGVISLFVEVNGCRSAVASETITVHSRPATPTLFAPQPTLCEGDPIVLQTNGTCNNFYWVSPMGINAVTLLNASQNTAAPSTAILPNDTAYLAGNWSVVCVSTEGCMSLPSASVAISISPKPAAPTVTQPGPQCEGNTITLVATSNVTAATYVWVGPNGFSFQGQSPSITNLSLTQAGDYGVVVLNNGCPSDTTWTTVLVDSTPAMPLPSVSGPICAGSTLQLNANATANGYIWVGPNGFTSTSANPSIPNATSNQSGYYQLILVENACSSDVAIVNVNVVENNNVPSLVANGPICEGGTLQLSAAPVSGNNVNYVWNCPGPMIDTTVVPSLVAPGVGLNATGWYSLAVLMEGCPSPNSSPVYVEVNARPAKPAIASNGPICEGGNIVLATTTQADSYLWQGPNSFLSTSQQPSVITNAQAYHSGVYSLRVTVDGCTSEDSTVAILVNAAGAAPGLTCNSPVCVGDTVRLQATAGADSYIWTCANGMVTTTLGPNLLIANSTVQHTGTYSVQAVYGACSTSVSAGIVVTVSESVLENAFAGDDQLVCNSANTTTLQAGNVGVGGLWTTNSDALIVSPGHSQTLISHLEVDKDYVFYWTLPSSGCRLASLDSVHVRLAHNPLANPNGFTLKDYAELVSAGILLNDSLWLQDVNLRVVAEPTHGSCSTNPNHTLNYLPESEFIGKDSLLYEICLKACPEMCDMAWVRFEINPRLVVPDLITPDGDGINDAFEMIGLENYPQHQLMVFNRWGNELLNTENYQNDWKGTYKGQPVPDGTYFWVILDSGNGQEILRGYLTIHR